MTDEPQNLPVPRNQAGAAGPTFPNDPQPGTYWRAKEDCPAAFREEVDQSWEREPDGTPKLNRRQAVARSALPKGTLLLVSFVHEVDGHAHTVVTAPDPNVSGDVARDWLVADFLAMMEPVAEEEAQSERDRQSIALMARIDQLRGEMSAIASSVRSDDRPKLAPSSAGATPTVIGQRRAEAESRALSIQAKADQIASVNERLVSEVSALARLQGEKAQAALASVRDALRLAQEASRAMESLDLFGGKKVECIALRDGTPAGEGIPVAIYQNRLFLDEETAVHLHEGGFDHRDLGSLPDMIRRHPGLVDRMVPDARGVALVRVRRGAKQYADPETAKLIDFLAEVEMQEQDKMQFLLLRDGERVTLVFAELALQDVERLFPTKDEMDRPFRGRSGAESIGFDDTRYVAALSKFEEQALAYKRLLILLWGLEFSERRPLGRIDPAREHGDWMSAEWQASHARFIADDDTVSLPDARPGIKEWLAANRRMIQAGSRVSVINRDAITPESAPSCAKRVETRDGERIERAWLPQTAAGTYTVKSSGGELYVEMAVKHAWKAGAPPRTARVDITQCPHSFLVLDVLDEREMSHYAESRISRRHYLDYLSLFHEARTALAREFGEIRAHDAAAAERLSDAFRDKPASEVLAAAKTAHALLRATRGGTPARASEARLVDATAAMILSGSPSAEAILSACGASMDEAIHGGFDGRGRLRVLAEGPDDPFARPGAWIRDLEAQADKSGRWKAPKASIRTVKRPYEPSIYPVIETGGLARRAWAGRLPEQISSPDDSAAIGAVIARATPAAIRSWHGPAADPDETARSWHDTARHWTFVRRPQGAGGRGVVTPYDRTMVGALVDLNGRHGEGRPRLSLLAITTDPLARSAVADPGVVDRLLTGNLGSAMPRGLLGSLWENSGTHVAESLRKLASGPRPPRAGLADPTISVEEADRRTLAEFAARRGPLRVHHAGSDARSRRSMFSGESVGAWEVVAYDSGIRPRGNGEITGRLIMRKDVLDLLTGQLGFPSELPAYMEFREIPGDE